MAIDHMAELLLMLLEDGFVPAGLMGPRHLRRTRSLFEAGVLDSVRKGGGRRIVVRDPSALAVFVEKLYPSGTGETGYPELPPRARAVLRLRNAKRAFESDAEPVLLRGFKDALLCSEEDTLRVAELTRTAGLAAIRLTDSFCWGFAGEVAVVENQEVFFHFERLDLSSELVVYAGGRLSGRVLRWLGSPLMEACRYVHCGDYDPIGLDEYMRLSARCPGRVELHLPLKLEDLFSRYGKPELLRDSPDILARLRKSPDPFVLRVVDLMDRFGAGLEQEILLADDRCSLP